MKAFDNIKKYIKQQGFAPGLLGVFTNPFYFARKGLFDSIKSLSFHISGHTLDVGCGSKPYQNLFKLESYTGLDFDKDGTNFNPDADYLYDGTHFPFDNEVYDSCVSSQVLEHVFEPGQFLSEINRVLKIDGILLLTVPFVWDEHEQPYDYARYSSFGSKYLLEKHGFEVLIQKKSLNDISVIFQLMNAYIQKKILINSNRYINLSLTILCCSPINITGVVLSWLLPKNNDLYLDNIIVAKKVS